MKIPRPGEIKSPLLRILTLYGGGHITRDDAMAELTMRLGYAVDVAHEMLTIAKEET